MNFLVRTVTAWAMLSVLRGEGKEKKGLTSAPSFFSRRLAEGGTV